MKKINVEEAAIQRVAAECDARGLRDVVRNPFADTRAKSLGFTGFFHPP